MDESRRTGRSQLQSTHLQPPLTPSLRWRHLRHAADSLCRIIQDAMDREDTLKAGRVACLRLATPRDLAR